MAQWWAIFFGVVLFQNIPLNCVSVITNRSLLAFTFHHLYYWMHGNHLSGITKPNFNHRNTKIIFATIKMFIISCCVLCFLIFYPFCILTTVHLPSPPPASCQPPPQPTTHLLLKKGKTSYGESTKPVKLSWSRNKSLPISSRLSKASQHSKWDPKSQLMH